MPDGERLEDDLVGLSKAVINTAARPLRASSLFYSLYYLKEIKDIDEAAYDFMKISDELYKGFIGYGVISLYGELEYFNRAYIYKGEKVRRMDHDEYADFLHDQIEPEHREFVNLVTNNDRTLRKIPANGPEWMADHFRELEDVFSALSKIDERLDDLEYVYDLGQKQKSSGMMMDAGETGWPSTFGGKGWANIARHMKRRKEYPKTMWVDQSFAIEHNNANWLGKIAIDTEEFEIFRETFDHIPDGQIYPKGSEQKPSDVMRYGFQWLLDQNHKENMEPMFKLASNYSNEIEFDIERYTRMNYNG